MEESMSFIREILGGPLPGGGGPSQYSPLSLAFLGDAVYSLVIRTRVLAGGNRQAAKLPRDASGIVNAGAQAAAGRAIQSLLTEEEAAVYRRGRNANPEHRAKHATDEDYREATALEALLGWLFLQGEEERLLFLVEEGLKLTGKG